MLAGVRPPHTIIELPVEIAVCLEREERTAGTALQASAVDSVQTAQVVRLGEGVAPPSVFRARTTGAP